MIQAAASKIRGLERGRRWGTCFVVSVAVAATAVEPACPFGSPLFCLAGVPQRSVVIGRGHGAAPVGDALGVLLRDGLLLRGLRLPVSTSARAPLLGCRATALRVDLRAVQAGADLHTLRRIGLGVVVVA